LRGFAESRSARGAVGAAFEKARPGRGGIRSDKTSRRERRLLRRGNRASHRRWAVHGVQCEAAIEYGDSARGNSGHAAAQCEARSRSAIPSRMGENPRRARRLRALRGAPRRFLSSALPQATFPRPRPRHLRHEPHLALPQVWWNDGGRREVRFYRNPTALSNTADRRRMKTLSRTLRAPLRAPFPGALPKNKSLPVTESAPSPQNSTPGASF